MTGPIAVIDFETTGSSPGQGARATEIAAVLVQDGRVVGHYQSLMNSGAWVPPFIEQLTGISNAMLADAPPADEVMRAVMHFTRGCPLVAHNAAFDRGFWHAEGDRICFVYTDDPAVQSGAKFRELGMQIAAGVPLQVGEGADFRTFRWRA